MTIRRTAARVKPQLVQAGVPLLEGQEPLRRTTPVMTMRYAHLAPGAHSAVERAWSAIAPIGADEDVATPVPH